MKSSFLEYYKLVLDRISFDKNLFRKEYHKAIKQLRQVEKEQLHLWLQAQGLGAHLSDDKVDISEVPTHPV
jgi:hypothetical protein